MKPNTDRSQEINPKDLLFGEKSSKWKKVQFLEELIHQQSEKLMGLIKQKFSSEFTESPKHEKETEKKIIHPPWEVRSKIFCPLLFLKEKNVKILEKKKTEWRVKTEERKLALSNLVKENEKLNDEIKFLMKMNQKIDRPPSPTGNGDGNFQQKVQNIKRENNELKKRHQEVLTNFSTVSSRVSEKRSVYEKFLSKHSKLQKFLSESKRSIEVAYGKRNAIRKEIQKSNVKIRELKAGKKKIQVEEISLIIPSRGSGRNFLLSLREKNLRIEKLKKNFKFFLNDINVIEIEKNVIVNEVKECEKIMERFHVSENEVKEKREKILTEITNRKKMIEILEKEINTNMDKIHEIKETKTDYLFENLQKKFRDFREENTKKLKNEITALTEKFREKNREKCKNIFLLSKIEREKEQVRIQFKRLLESLDSDENKVKFGELNFDDSNSILLSELSKKLNNLVLEKEDTDSNYQNLCVKFKKYSNYCQKERKKVEVKLEQVNSLMSKYEKENSIYNTKINEIKTQLLEKERKKMQNKEEIEDKLDEIKRNFTQNETTLDEEIRNLEEKLNFNQNLALELELKHEKLKNEQNLCELEHTECYKKKLERMKEDSISLNKERDVLVNSNQELNRKITRFLNEKDILIVERENNNLFVQNSAERLNVLSRREEEGQKQVQNFFKKINALFVDVQKLELKEKKIELEKEIWQKREDFIKEEEEEEEEDEDEEDGIRFVGEKMYIKKRRSRI